MSEKSSFIFVLGNGPSLRNFNFHSLEGYNTIGMNVAFRHWHRINWYPKYYMCMDTVMCETQKYAIRELVFEFNKKIELFFLRKRILAFYPELQKLPYVLFLEDYIKTPYFSGLIITTGSFAPLFATMLGYRQIYLLGIDLNLVERIPESKHVNGSILEITETPKHNPNYFFDDYQQKGDIYNIPNPTPNLHRNSWKQVKKRLDQFNVDVVNCSKISKLDIFNKLYITEFIKG